MNDELKKYSKKKIFVKAVEARLRAYVPYSKFKVGAAVLPSNSKKIYTGANVENASYGGTMCAERVAILSAVHEGHKKFDEICIVGKSKPFIIPCGMCLQVMSEFCKPETKIILASPTKVERVCTFKDLLPLSFDGKSL